MRKMLCLLGLVGVALGFAAPAAAKTCEMTITGNDQIQYNKSELVVGPDCDKVKITLEHVGQMSIDQMGHNVVVTETSDYKAVAQAGMQAKEQDYVPADDDRVIAHTSMIGGGQTTSVTFDVSGLEPGGDYTFFCSFPGHYGMMNGKLIVE